MSGKILCIYTLCAIAAMTTTPSMASYWDQCGKYRNQYYDEPFASRENACDKLKSCPERDKCYARLDADAVSAPGKAATAPSASPAEPTSCSCSAFVENQQMTLRGTIVQSATTEESEGEPPHKFMAISLDNPICLATDTNNKYTLLDASEVSTKWLGHYVDINGTIDGCVDGYCLQVKSIKDVSQDAANSAPNPDSAVHSDADQVDDQKLATVSCRWVVRPDRGTDDSITEQAVDHLEAFRDRGKLPDKYFWSACTMYEYVVAECRAHPRASVLDAVNSLIGKAKAGKGMPSVPRCGA
jgi:hypothetical protein